MLANSSCRWLMNPNIIFLQTNFKAVLHIVHKWQPCCFIYSGFLPSTTSYIHTRGVEKKSKHIKKYFEIFESHFQRQLKNSIILWRTPISIMLEMQTSKSIISQRSEGFEEWASIQLHTVQDLQYYMAGKTNKQKKKTFISSKSKVALFLIRYCDSVNVILSIQCRYYIIRVKVLDLKATVKYVLTWQAFKQPKLYT